MTAASRNNSNHWKASTCSAKILQTCTTGCQWQHAPTAVSASIDLAFSATTRRVAKFVTYMTNDCQVARPQEPVTNGIPISGLLWHRWTQTTCKRIANNLHTTWLPEHTRCYRSTKHLQTSAARSAGLKIASARNQKNNRTVSRAAVAPQLYSSHHMMNLRAALHSRAQLPSSNANTIILCPQSVQ